MGYKGNRCQTRSRTFGRHCLDATVWALTLWALGRLGAEDAWAPPFGRHRLGAVGKTGHISVTMRDTAKVTINH